jgi:hypothetical protein
MTKKAKKIIITLLVVFFGIPLFLGIIISIAGGSESSGTKEASSPAVAESAPAIPASAPPAPAPKPKPEDDPNYTGVWRINNFVDEFGDKIDDRYIALWAEGTFSNSATKDEKLRVLFLITNDSVGLEMYEDYFGIKNDVATTFILFDPATVTIRDKDGTDHRLQGRTPDTSGQRLYIAPSAEAVSALKKGGMVRFSINDGGSTYRFDIPNADYFDRAYSQL